MKLRDFLLCTFMFSGAAHAADYYVSNTGSDSNAGTSEAAPWATLSKVNLVDLNAGDTVRLQCGSTFSGGLTLTAGDSGGTDLPVLIDAYGCDGNVAAPIINAGAGSAITLTDVSDVILQNLELRGAGTWDAAGNFTGNSGLGIDASSTQANAKINDVIVYGIKASGFSTGMRFRGTNGSSGFSNLLVNNATVQNNASGLVIDATGTVPSGAWSHQQVTVKNSLLTGNAGRAGSSVNPGRGLALESADGAVVEDNQFSSNGAWGTVGASFPGGAVFHNIRGLQLRKNEAKGNGSASAGSANGFRFTGLEAATLEQNFSRGNWGSGFIFHARADSKPASGSVLRYNVSVDDALSGVGIGAIELVDNSHVGLNILNNSVMLSEIPPSSVAALRIVNGVQNVVVKNNISQNAGQRHVALYAGVGSLATLVLDRNDYYSPISNWRSQLNGTDHASLAAWRTASGQDLNTVSVAPRFCHNAAELGGKDLSLAPDTQVGGLAEVLTQQGLTDFTGGDLPATGRALGAFEPRADACNNDHPLRGLSDDFDDGQQALVWRVVGSGTAVESGGALRVTPAANYSGVAGYSAGDTHNLRNGSTWVNVQQVMSGSGSTHLKFKAGTNYINVKYDNGYLRLTRLQSGDSAEVILASVPYNAAQMGWWRLREAGGVVYGEYAADPNGTWSTIGSFTPSFSTSELQVELLVNTPSTATPGTAIFDNLNLGWNNPNQ